jgi:hypothetical protein
LFSDLQNLAYLENEGDRPFGVTWCVVPVGGRLGVDGESRMRLGRVSEERLQKHLAKTLPILLDDDGPELVHEHACGQSAHLFEHHKGRSNRERAGAEKRMRSGWIKEGGPDAPNQAERSGIFGRKKETLRRIAEPVLRTILNDVKRFGHILDVKEVVLRNDRKNRAQNEIPILVQGNGNDRLNVERELVSIM